jgi:hypothetical protein
MHKHGIWVCVFGLMLCNGFTQTDRQMIEYDRRIAAQSKTYIPVGGYVPDADTAKQIAAAVATPIFGKKQVDSEMPLKAGLKDGVWTVIGTCHCTVGGELIVQIDEKTAGIRFVGHTQ